MGRSVRPAAADAVHDPAPAELPPAQITVVVPVLGRDLARAVRESDQWRDYVELFRRRRELTAVAPGSPTRGLPDASAGADLTGAAGVDSCPASDAPSHAAKSRPTLAREVAQAIAQRLPRSLAVQ